jgi:hypothetical protein
MPASIAEPPTEEQPVLPAARGPGLGEHTSRFIELAAAVRRHEGSAGHPSVPKRPADHALYQALDEIER